MIMPFTCISAKIYDSLSSGCVVYGLCGLFFYTECILNACTFATEVLLFLQLTKKWQQSKPALETLGTQLQRMAQLSDPSRKVTSSGAPVATNGHGTAEATSTQNRKSHLQALKQPAPVRSAQKTGVIIHSPVHIFYMFYTNKVKLLA